MCMTACMGVTLSLCVYTVYNLRTDRYSCVRVEDFLSWLLPKHKDTDCKLNIFLCVFVTVLTKHEENLFQRELRKAREKSASEKEACCVFHHPVVWRMPNYCLVRNW